jgi:hypothetical protein
VDNIKMDLGEVGWGGVDWSGLAQYCNISDALVNAVMNVLFHRMLGNYGVARQLVASVVMLNSI